MYPHMCKVDCPVANLVRFPSCLTLTSTGRSKTLKDFLSKLTFTLLLQFHFWYFVFSVTCYIKISLCVDLQTLLRLHYLHV